MYSNDNRTIRTREIKRGKSIGLLLESSVVAKVQASNRSPMKLVMMPVLDAAHKNMSLQS
jgi:hypothetical protein